MKSIVTALVAILVLPAVCIAQTFKAPDLSAQTDFALLSKEIQKHSPLFRQFQSLSNVEVNITPEEARALVKDKLKELNNEQLNNLYAKLDDGEGGDGSTQIGVALYILMNGLSNTDDDDPVDYKSKIGGGLGVYVMWQLANFILMPELAFMIRPFGAEYGGDEYREKYSYLTLAFTAMYIIRMQTLSLLLGLSPNFGYALGGKYKYGDDDWEDVDFDDDGVNRSNFGLGIAAGLMLQNGMIFRLMYNMGLSKIAENNDWKMYAIMLSIYYPIWKK